MGKVEFCNLAVSLGMLGIIFTETCIGKFRFHMNLSNALCLIGYQNGIFRKVYVV